MKKLTYILLAAAVAFVSCAKEIAVEEPQNVEPQKEVKTITFNASVQLNTETKAALDGLKINWSSGDYVGVATDNDATIRAYAVTPDSSDPTKCTITVNEVEGATAYYVLFKGSLGADGDATKESAADDFSAISFDTTTKTFTGLKVGSQQVDKNSLNSHIWYSSGYPLSMVGKADGTSLVMKPCLALVKVQIAEQSVFADKYVEVDYTSTKNIVHTHGYSAVRGFNLYQKGSSTLYSSGDYTVQVADNGDIAVSAVNNDNKKEYRQISQSDPLVKETNYLMCLIPGGDITSFKFDFLGYKEDKTLSWDAVYTMAHSGSINVAPGDFFDFGVLNPVGRKIAKNEAADDAADEAAASYVPAITIDGSFGDWNLVEASKLVSASAPTADYQEFKVTYDKFNIYFYSKRNTARFTELYANNAYVWFKIDTNNDVSDDYEKKFYIYPYSNASGSALQFDKTPSSHEISGLTISSDGFYDSTNQTIEIEVSVPRSELGISDGDVLLFETTCNKVNSGSTLTITSGLTISD